MAGDVYEKLRAFRAPDDDLCDCAEVTDLTLKHVFTDNPLNCLYCNGEVPPERIELAPELVDPIARWNRLAGAFYELWLDSGEWEEYAAAQLRDPSGRLVEDGLDIVRRLSADRPTFYSWISEEGVTHAGCPRCSAPLQPVATRVGARRLCIDCRIAVFPDW